MTCSLTSKDITIVSGYIPPSGISLPNRQSAKPLDPVSTKSGEGHLVLGQCSVQRISGRHRADQDKHDKSHALLSVVRTMREGDPSGSKNEQHANPERGRARYLRLGEWLSANFMNS